MSTKDRFYVDIMALQPEVTGSCNLVIVKYPDGNSSKFVVDCGMFQERAYSDYNKSFPFDAETIDFCIITHNHVDHTGRLPLLVRQGFKGDVYMTEPTSVLIPLALEDSHKVVRDLARRNHEHELYSDGNVSEVLSRRKAIPYGETEQITPNIRVTMFKNGHLVGAAIVLVQISYYGCEDINIIFTGDYNNKNIFFDVEDLPEWVLDLPLTIVQESTYGTTDSESTVECFEKNIVDCIERRGTVVSLVFSLGRFQEILYKLKCMQEDGKISTDVPIYADGKLGIRYTNLFVKNKIGIKEEMRDFLPENLTFVGKDSREDVLTSTKTKIIVTTSGMGTYGPAPQYILSFIRQKNCLIQFNGYTAEGTMGEKLKSAEAGETVTVAGVFPVKRARVEYTTEFSAHAKADEMIEFLKKFRNAKLVLVNHGNFDAKEKFARRVVKEVDAKDVGILGRDHLYRIGHYGLIRTMSTKFE